FFCGAKNHSLRVFSALYVANVTAAENHVAPVFQEPDGRAAIVGIDHVTAPNEVVDAAKDDRRDILLIDAVAFALRAQPIVVVYACERFPPASTIGARPATRKERGIYPIAFV